MPPIDNMMNHGNKSYVYRSSQEIAKELKDVFDANNAIDEQAGEEWPHPPPMPQSMRARHPNSARFHEILKELGELHDKKQADYGRGDDPFANIRATTEWGTPAWVGAMIRATDKVRRLQALLLNGKLANESAEDSLRDLAVYSVIALVLFEQDQK